MKTVIVTALACLARMALAADGCVIVEYPDHFEVACTGEASALAESEAPSVVPNPAPRTQTAHQEKVGATGASPPSEQLAEEAHQLSHLLGYLPMQTGRSSRNLTGHYLLTIPDSQHQAAPQQPASRQSPGSTEPSAPGSSPCESEPPGHAG